MIIALKIMNLISVLKAENQNFLIQNNSLNIKLIYDRNKFVVCPDNYSKIWKYFYQHDLDKLLLSEKFTKQIFEKACKAELAHEMILPYELDNNINKVRTKLKLYNYIPIYTPTTVNRQWCPRFNVPLSGSFKIDDAQFEAPTFLLFNSRFESGNLERAYKIEEVYGIPQYVIRKSAMSKNIQSANINEPK